MFVINRNWLTPMQRLVSWYLDAKGTGKIYLVDCLSEYPPLLQWYREIEQNSRVEVIRTSNLGGRGIWKSKIIHESFKRDRYDKDQYIVTDGDLYPDLEVCPDDLVPHLRDILESYNWRAKDNSPNRVGPGIKLHDLPDHFSYKESIQRFEGAYWRPAAYARDWDAYGAPIATTFALYDRLFDHFSGGGSFRTNAPYMVEHYPWYVDSSNPGEEANFFVQHSDENNMDGSSHFARIMKGERPFG